VERFRGFVARRLGLHMEETKLTGPADLLRRRLDANGGSCAAFLDHLETEQGKPELRAIAVELSVPETYFFRNADQFRAFSGVVLPDRMQARTGTGQRQLRILSAGCASGEEAYSLAIDLIVSHMLELGKKSQQIGSVLEIVSELAEQTNILAINATIEAAGAGESGKRFAVVADEIRKLADRVAASTKEIRTLIEDVRSAVNTTVMTTETGSKSVDAGSKQFGDVTAALKQITGLVTTTTEAAREIELSTKQQTTAVEQVNLAISNVAQATRETEASSGQTLQAVSQLTTVSKGLLRLVQDQATG
jgi:uncharacterized protein YukE